MPGPSTILQIAAALAAFAAAVIIVWSARDPPPGIDFSLTDGHARWTERNARSNKWAAALSGLSAGLGLLSIAIDS
jgi:hypothetical protein